MDTRYFGSNLITFNVQEDRCRLSPEVAENPYYKRHAPAPVDGRVLRIASALAAAWFGFVAFGIWLQ